jgi:twitching motility protein PilU
MGFKDLLKIMIAKEGSDLFLTADAPPSIKAFGHMVPLGSQVLPAGTVEKIAAQLMTPEQARAFEKDPELNIALSEPDVGRFRINIFKQRGQLAMVARHIKTDIPSCDQLGLPDTLKNLVMSKRGLVMFVGGTGSGKSTSLAALIDYRNQNSDGHIITVEDPIEFIHPHKKSIVSQREVGVDTASYEAALKNTLRQAPDVILIGEIRSQDTMEHALAFAETGHLCLSTLHANNANQALDRIINFFPEERHKQLFLDLSLNLRGLVSQRLIPSVDGRRAAAFEILLGTPRVCDLVKQGKVDEIKEVMEKSEDQGMQTFDSALYTLFKQGRITEEEALKNADSRNNLRLRIQLSEGKTPEPADEFAGLALRPKD